MDLSVLGVTERKAKQFEAVGVTNVQELLAFYPRKYEDRTQLTGPVLDRKDATFLMRVDSVTRKFYKVTVIEAKGTLLDKGRDTQIPVQVTWFNTAHLYDKILACLHKTTLVCGQVAADWNMMHPQGFYRVTAPSLFTEKADSGLGIYPSYRKIPGMAAAYLESTLEKALALTPRLEETLPEAILKEHGLLSHDAMLRTLHKPGDKQQLEAAQRRRLWDELLYFALRVEISQRTNALGSPYGLPVVRLAKAVEDSLPFRLTEDQSKVYRECLAHIRSGRRTNALIQGDVGTGKTIVALLLMIAFAENGYQAVLMAPTQLLAQQHYDKLAALVASYGIKTVFVSGQKLRKAEQKALEESLATGEAKLIVGTQALLSETYQFQNLALVIEDEEHKYGVEQRETLAQKAAAGIHTITMSATPIPRSLAQTIYGDNLQLYSIRTKPAGREPIQTGHARDMARVYRYLCTDIKKKGHQAYVVCPMVARNEKVEGVASAEEVYEQYRKELEPYGISVGVVTGKTKKQEAQQILRDFQENRISILVSTTVIEVGIDVPNATCIVIHNAERFGLAQLHQLRGRVGRGKDPGICVLLSDSEDNPRIEAMCSHTDGFEIAELDLKQRGAGDFMGIKQSGTEKYLSMALTYPEEYSKAQLAAKQILDSGSDCILLDQAIEDFKSKKGGEMLC